jgi:hypothetical protein
MLNEVKQISREPTIACQPHATENVTKSNNTALEETGSATEYAEVNQKVKAKP